MGEQERGLGGGMLKNNLKEPRPWIKPRLIFVHLGPPSSSSLTPAKSPPRRSVNILSMNAVPELGWLGSSSTLTADF